jgi:hypothetical protein
MKQIQKSNFIDILFGSLHLTASCFYCVSVLTVFAASSFNAMFLTISKVPVLAKPLAKPPSNISGVNVHPLIQTFKMIPTTAIMSGMYLFGINGILCFIIYPKHRQIAKTTITTYLDKNSTRISPFPLPDYYCPSIVICTLRKKGFLSDVVAILILAVVAVLILDIVDVHNLDVVAAHKLDTLLPTYKV